MALVAPYSKYRRNNLTILIVVCLVCAGWFYKDGYHNEEFIAKHTQEDGTADSTLAFNQKSPPIFLAGAIISGILLFVVKGRKIVAQESELVIDGKKKIAYDSIQQIDKTNLDPDGIKGYFVLTYKNVAGNEEHEKISAKSYDNLPAIVGELASKIS